jgi:hypothetical protein
VFCKGAVGAKRRQAFEARSRALPLGEFLSAWYRNLRADWWRRYTLHRFLQDAATGRILVFGGLARSDEHFSHNEIPSSIFSYDVILDADGGRLFAARDRRIPLAADLRFHRPDDIPPAAIEAESRRSLRARAGGQAARAARAARRLKRGVTAARRTSLDAEAEALRARRQFSLFRVDFWPRKWCHAIWFRCPLNKDHVELSTGAVIEGVEHRLGIFFIGHLAAKCDNIRQRCQENFICRRRRWGVLNVH